MSEKKINIKNIKIPIRTWSIDTKNYSTKEQMTWQISTEKYT